MARTNTLELLPLLANFDYADPTARLIAADYAEENDDPVLGGFLRRLRVERIRNDAAALFGVAGLHSPARFQWNRRLDGPMHPAWLTEWFGSKRRGATPDYWLESRDGLKTGATGACLVVARVVYNPAYPAPGTYATFRRRPLAFAWQASVIAAPGRYAASEHGKPTVRSPEAAVVDLLLALRATDLLPPICGPHGRGEDPLDELVRRCGCEWNETAVRYAHETRPTWWGLDTD